MITWYELQRNLTDRLENRKDELLTGKDAEDFLHELINETIPGNYNDLADLLANNHNLAHVKDAELIDTNEIDIFKIIQTAIYEQLSELATEWLEEARQEAEEFLMAA